MATTQSVADESERTDGQHSVTTNRLFRLLGWLAVVLGLGLAAGGIGHLFGVVSVTLEERRPYDSRMVSLLTIGFILLYAATVNLGVSRWLREARVWAVAITGFTTICLMIYLVILLPLPDGGSFSMGFLLANSAYLFLLVWSSIVKARENKARQCRPAEDRR